jgi:hypothetical protein
MAVFPLNLSSWKYRKRITISGSTGAGTNYQVPLKVGESAGSTGADFHVEGHSAKFPSGKNDSGDLRFAASDGVTPLDFWVESVVGTSPNRVAYVWVEVSANLDTNQDIYCYYGNPAATNVSNGDNTFLFFDDFDTDTIGTKWTYTGNGSYSIANSIITLYNSDTAGRWYKTINQVLATIGNFSVRFLGKHEGSWDLGAGIVNSDGSNKFIHCLGRNYGNYKSHLLIVASSLVRDYQYEASDLNWHIVEERNIGTTFYAILDGIQKDSYSVSNQTGGYVSIYNSGAGNQYVDWILVRKYVSPEPAFYSAGAEEKRSTIIPFII